MKTCEYMEAPWFADLTRAIEATNKTVVAAKMGVNRSTLSAVVNGIGEYGKGTASTAKFQRQFQWAFGQMPCTYTGKNIDISYCRQHALVPAPLHNPMALRHWQGCQKCEHKNRLVQMDERVKAKADAPVPPKQMSVTAYIVTGKATSAEEAYQEGWDSIGGPNDNPYRVEDSRSDYWRTGYNQRREFDRKQRERMKAPKAEAVKDEKPQQAGNIDKVTLPLPEVGGPQVQEAIQQSHDLNV